MLPKDPEKLAAYRKALSDKAKLRTGDKNSFYGRTHKEETIETMKEAKVGLYDGKSNPMYGKKHTSDSIEKIRIAANKRDRKGKKRSPEMQELLRGLRKGKPMHPNSMKAINDPKSKKKLHDIMQTEEYKQKQREAQSGEKSHLWKGGKSFEPYCEKFNNGLKERVRKYQRYTCAICGKIQMVPKLCVHHVNYDKMTCCNNSKPLFVLLCRSCHNKTTMGNRLVWESIFLKYIENILHGKCYFTIEEIKNEK